MPQTQATVTQPLRASLCPCIGQHWLSFAQDPRPKHVLYTLLKKERERV